MIRAFESIGRWCWVAVLTVSPVPSPALFHDSTGSMTPSCQRDPIPSDNRSQSVSMYPQASSRRRDLRLGERPIGLARPCSTVGERADHFRQRHFTIVSLKPVRHRDPDPALGLGVAGALQE
jgi:hypothetical protein